MLIQHVTKQNFIKTMKGSKFSKNAIETLFTILQHSDDLLVLDRDAIENTFEEVTTKKALELTKKSDFNDVLENEDIIRIFSSPKYLLRLRG